MTRQHAGVGAWEAARRVGRRKRSVRWCVLACCKKCSRGVCPRTQWRCWSTICRPRSFPRCRTQPNSAPPHRKHLPASNQALVSNPHCTWICEVSGKSLSADCGLLDAASRSVQWSASGTVVAAFRFFFRSVLSLWCVCVWATGNVYGPVACSPP